MSGTCDRTLILSLSSDGALQQVLTDNLGHILVGETPNFLNADIDSTLIQTLSMMQQPLALNITKKIQEQKIELMVLCPQNLLCLPWVEYLTNSQTHLLASDICIKALDRLDDSRETVQSVGVDKFRFRAETQPARPTRFNQHVFSLSYDLVDSTTLMAQLGAESYAVMLSHLHKKFAAIAAHWYGQIDLPQGDDGCMCYFGARNANEHDGLACLQAALEMRSVARINGWKIRIGIAAGWVAVDSNQPVGLSVHLAARLQKLATVNSIFVTQEMALHFFSVFEFTPVAHTIVSAD